jgi:hypothetical protein
MWKGAYEHFVELKPPKIVPDKTMKREIQFSFNNSLFNLFIVCYSRYSFGIIYSSIIYYLG